MLRLSSMSNNLNIKNLQVKIKDTEILCGVDLEIKSGEMHVIMGPNGSGKSTLASVLAGHPSYGVTGGKVELSLGEISGKSLSHKNHSLLDLSPDERANLGLFLAFQYPVEVPGVRILNFLWEAYKTRFNKKDRRFTSIVDFRDYLYELMIEMGLDKNFVMRGLNEGFSGGEKKRLEVLQMMVLEPKFAILDETDSGLDVDAIKIVARGIRRTRNRFNTGMIVITHYQRILEYLEPDFVHIMVDGKIVKTGKTELIDEVEKSGYESFGN